MKTKITKTLIESWQYIFDCYEGGEEDAMVSFLQTLKREPLEPTEAMINGTNFENMCYRFAEHYGGVPVNKQEEGWLKGCMKILPYIEGGQFQVPVSCDLTINGHDFWLYGICDTVKAGTIFDIKYKNKGLGAAEVYGNYLNCSQHSIYLKALPEANRFIYLVSDGEELYTEEYTRKTAKPVEEYILNFWSWLQSNPELLKIYEERWAVE